MIAIAEFFEAGVGWGSTASAGPDVFHEEEPLRILDRQHAQQHCIDQAEDGRVRADTQRQRQYGNGGEARRVAQYASGIAQVLQQALDGGPPPRLATDLPPERGVAE